MLRALQQPASEGREFSGTNLVDVVEQMLGADVSSLAEPVARWRGLEHLTALDFDCPDGAARLRDEDLPELFPEALPRPHAAWVTHGGGLRALFIAHDAVPADALAGVWALLASIGVLAGWPLEAKSDTRHPAGARGAERCGNLFRFAPSTKVVFPDGGLRTATESEIQDWLDERGLSFGRYESRNCPWCGAKPGSGNPSVVVDDRGVQCHRCQRFQSWDSLVGAVADSERPSLYESAHALVHFPHQRHVLHELRPGVPQRLLQPAWRALLHAANADRMKNPNVCARVEMAGSELIDVVRAASGAWLDARTLRPRKVSADRTLKEIPSIWSRTMADQALNSDRLPGYVAIEALPAIGVIAPHTKAPAGAIHVRRPHGTHEPPPVNLGSEPPKTEDVDSAYGAAEGYLPGLHRGLLQGLIEAGLVAQRCVGLPPIATITGPTGRAKTAHVAVAGAALGRRVADVLLGDADDTRRKIGLAVENGASHLLFDEIGRQRRIYERLGVILALNHELTFRPKHQNERRVRVGSAICLVGSTLPHAVTRSPELARRSAGWRLLTRCSGWDRYGDLSEIRSVPEMRAVLDVVVAHSWWRLHANPALQWRQACMEQFGAVPLGDLDLDVSSRDGHDEAIRRLYGLYRSAPPTAMSHWLSRKGWLVANPDTDAGLVLAELVDMSGERAAAHAATHELERTDLEPILGFTEPKLQLLVRRHNATWLVRFVEPGVLKGRERRREELPELGERAGESS